MQFDQLKCFVEVAETKSFSKAAENLFISQQAISKNVKNLEEALGCELFFRTKNGVFLTVSGESVLEFALHFFETEKALTKKLGNIQQAMDSATLTAELVMGSTSPIITSVVPAILRRIETKGNINTLMKLYDVDTIGALLKKVYEKEIYCGLVTSYEAVLQAKLEPYDEQLGIFVIAQDKLVAVMDRNFFQADIDYSDFRIYAMAKPLTAYNVPPEPDLASMLNHSIVSCSDDESFHCNMMREVGAVTIMPELVYQKKFSSKRYVSLQLDRHQPISLLHAIIYRKGLEYHADTFFDMFRRELYMK